MSSLQVYGAGSVRDEPMAEQSKPRGTQGLIWFAIIVETRKPTHDFI